MAKMNVHDISDIRHDIPLVMVGTRGYNEDTLVVGYYLSFSYCVGGLGGEHELIPYLKAHYTKVSTVKEALRSIYQLVSVEIGGNRVWGQDNRRAT